MSCTSCCNKSVLGFCPQSAANNQACSKAAGVCKSGDCQRRQWPSRSAHATTCMPASPPSAKGVLLRRKMRITRPFQSKLLSPSLPGSTICAFKSARHWPKLTCAKATVSMRDCVTSRVRIKVSKPRQPIKPSKAIKASATSTSIKVKPKARRIDSASQNGADPQQGRGF